MSGQIPEPFWEHPRMLTETTKNQSASSSQNDPRPEVGTSIYPSFQIMISDSGETP